jgi:hypothetical protein
MTGAFFVKIRAATETEHNPMDDCISEDDPQTFEGFLRYQAIPANSPRQELEMWRGFFDEAMQTRKSSPKFEMKLHPIPGEQKYAVAIRDRADLWLAMWVRCSRKGEIFIMVPHRNGSWDAHASYHLDGTFHQKSHRAVMGLPLKKQPLTEAFKDSEHLGLYARPGLYARDGKSSGAVCDPRVFDGVVEVEPGILGSKYGRVGIDLLTPEYQPRWNEEISQRLYRSGVRRQVFSRDGRPSLVITIQQ